MEPRKKPNRQTQGRVSEIRVWSCWHQGQSRLIRFVQLTSGLLGLGSVLARFVSVLLRFGSSRIKLDSVWLCFGSVCPKLVQHCSGLSHLRLSLVQLGPGFFVFSPARFRLSMVCSKLFEVGPLEFECGSDQFWLGSDWFRCWHAELCLVQAWLRFAQVFVRVCSDLGRLHLGLARLASGSVRLALICSSSLWVCRFGLGLGLVLAGFVLVLQRFGSGRLKLDSVWLCFGSACLKLVQHCSGMFHLRLSLVQLGSGFFVLSPAWFRFPHGLLEVA